MEYIFTLIKKVYDSYDKYNKPLYNDDTYHKKCYLVNDGEWVKEEISENIFFIVATLNNVLLSKAEAKCLIMRVTEEMMLETMEQTGEYLKVGTFVNSNGYRNINLLDYEDYESYMKNIIDNINTIIYLDKEEQK